jgi:hypothetical protein
MSTTSVLNTIGAVGTVGLGCLGLFAPKLASKMSGLSPTIPEDLTAFAEFRGTFGGSFALMGLVPLISGNKWAYFMAGMFWLGASGGRFLSLILDRGYRDLKNVGGVFFEGGFAALLLVGTSVI